MYSAKKQMKQIYDFTISPLKLLAIIFNNNFS